MNNILQKNAFSYEIQNDKVVVGVKEMKQGMILRKKIYEYRMFEKNKKIIKKGILAWVKLKINSTNFLTVFISNYTNDYIQKR